LWSDVFYASSIKIDIKDITGASKQVGNRASILLVAGNVSELMEHFTEAISLWSEGDLSICFLGKLQIINFIICNDNDKWQ
jgi:hypothetical protein